LIIDQFSKSPHPGALILNPKAAGVGLNITAANHVIHFNPEYNPAVTSQATARAFRRKQELPVFVHHLYYVETLEETAIRISHAKRMVANGVDAGVGLV
jgi:SNF2 family DNA or RNA helicase